MPELWITFVSLLIIGTISYNYTVVMPLFVEQGLHGNDTDYTLVYAAFSVGAVVGAFAVARRVTVTLRTVVVSTLWLGVSMLALAAVPNVAVAYFVAAVVGGASVAYMTGTTAIAQLRTHPQMVGRVLALQAVLIAGTTPIGGPLLGAIADVAGGRSPMYIGAAGAFLAAIVVIVAMRRLGYSGREPIAAPSST
jgi:MFS family permease